MVGSERRVGKHKFPTRTHGKPRGDTQFYWTRRDQLETRAGRTKTRRSLLTATFQYSNPFSFFSLTPWCHGA